MDPSPTLAWHDDRLVADADLVISADDPGFLMGDGLFETMLVKDGVVDDLAGHLARFEASRVALAFPAPPTDPASAIAALVAAQTRPGATVPSELVLRMTLTSRPTLVIRLRPVSARDLVRRSGLELHTLSERRGESFLARHKTLAWGVNAVARRLHPRGGDERFEGLWLDTDGCVLECHTSNLFARFGDVVYTAPLSAPILPGVSRTRVIAGLAALGVEVRQTLIVRPALDDADELFASNAVLGVAPILSLDARPLAHHDLARALTAP